MTARAFDKRPFLLLCEGESDKRFFDRLIENRQIENSFQVWFPHRGNDRGGGRSKFGAWLDIAADAEEFIEYVKAVLVVSDNDSDPEKSFAEVLASLKEAPAFPVPKKEREVAYVSGAPPLVVLMLPIGKKGALETLCLEAAYKKWPIKPAVDGFALATAANSWSIGKQSKMKLQCVIAATCEPRPDAGFVGHWWEKNDFHIPLDHPIFDDIADFLKGFRSMIEGSTAPEVNAAAARPA
jgi:Protein of unknown function (DUF3226)